MPDPDWLLPARSIPVWVGAHVTGESGNPSQPLWTGVVMEIHPRQIQVFEGAHPIMGHHVDAGIAFKSPRNTFIDLSNPDTFAAARDRLAQRMWPHCDKSAGVAFYLSSRHAAKQRWVLGTFPTGDDVNVTRDFPMPSGASRELALALAWQKVVGA